MHVRPRSFLALTLCSLWLASAARGDEQFALQGRDPGGDAYTARLTLRDADGQVAVTREVTLPDGRTATFTGRATRRGRLVYVRFQAGGGLTGVIEDEITPSRGKERGWRILRTNPSTWRPLAAPGR